MNHVFPKLREFDSLNIPYSDVTLGTKEIPQNDARKNQIFLDLCQFWTSNALVEK